jgi:hypothetical protein
MPETEGSLPLDQVDAQALFGGKNAPKKEKNDDKTITPKPVNVPSDESTCEVRLCTSGRLSAPPILHFYDYNMMSAQLISELPAQDNHMPAIVKILNTMIVEDFDCGKLHVEEIKEILLNVHAKWWGPMLHDFAYFLDPEITDPDKLMAKENISQGEIPIAGLTVVPLAEGIREPINIKSGGVEVNFLYPRAQNSGIADDCMKLKFAEQEQQFFKIKRLVDEKKYDEVPVSDLRAYNDYLAERAEWKLLYTRALTLCGVNREVLETLDDRVEALRNNKKISVRHWEKYNEFLKGKGAFGLKNEAEFYSDILSRKVKRGFRFRTYTLIPQMDAERDDEDEVSFG